jgi:hypothetical protein
MWDWLIYASLIAGWLAITATIVLFAIRILQAWREVRRLRRHVFRELDLVTVRVEATLERLDRVSDTGELETSVASLRVALARLAVLRAAMDEVSASVNRVTAFVPGM